MVMLEKLYCGGSSMFSFKKKWDDVGLFWFPMTMNTNRYHIFLYTYNIRKIPSISFNRSQANPCCCWRYLYCHGVYWTVTITKLRYGVTWHDFWLYSLSPEIIIERLGIGDLFWYRIASVPGDGRCAGWVRSWMSSSAGDSGSTCSGPVHRGATGGASRHRGCDLVTW